MRETAGATHEVQAQELGGQNPCASLRFLSLDQYTEKKKELKLPVCYSSGV